MVKNRGAAEQIFVAILLLDCSGRETAIEGEESDENESRDIQRGGGGLSDWQWMLCGYDERRGRHGELRYAVGVEIVVHADENAEECGGDGQKRIDIECGRE
nr:hypothetical protein Iba_chr05aCG8500 [Ipomoea batatas]